MRFHWDLTLNCLLHSPKSSSRLHTVDFKRGDAALIELVFYADSEPVLLEPGHEIRFAIKRKGQHDGEPLVYTATFTENTETRTYTASPSCNTASLTVLFASPNAPDRLDLMGEFSLRNGDQSQGWQSSQTLNVCVFNDVIRGNEGEPGSIIDSQQSWQWLLASLAAGANVTLMPDPVARVMTIGAVPGASGNGWSPLFAIAPDGNRRVLRLMSWTGGTGSPPTGAGQYLGSSGLVPAISDAVDLRGASGLQGNPGTNGINGLDGNDGNDGISGTNGWSPMFALVSDAERRVLQLTTWTGGTGDAPQGAGQYLGPAGLVSTPAEALDLRGAQGSAGINGIDGVDATPITHISFDGSSLAIQTSSGQNFGPFHVRGNDGSNGSDGTTGANGWSPAFAIIQDGERRVLQLQSWSGGTGSPPGSEGYYIGPSGLTPHLYEAVDMRGAQGPSGETGAPGADATPITGISFDGSSLTFQTSTGQSFGPFYVRGADGSDGPQGQQGAEGPPGVQGPAGADATPITGINFDGSNLTFQTSTGQSFGPFYVRGGDGQPGAPGANGADATPITSINFDGYNLTIYTSSGQNFGPFYVRGSDGSSGSDGAAGNHGWSPLFTIVEDGDRRVLQLQSWSGGSGSTPGYEGHYLGPSGFTPYPWQATDIRGPQGGAGQPGSSGSDATPITNITFDGYNLTIQTSSGQSFGPFYVRGNDGPPGADGSSGGNNGSDGTNGWSPLLSVVPDGSRRIIQLQGWSGGSGSSPGNEGSYLGPSGLTWSPGDATDISGSLQPLAAIDNVSGAVSLSGSDTVDITQLEAQITDLQTKLQHVLDRLRSHNLISAS